MENVYICMDCNYVFEDGMIFNKDMNGNAICPKCNSGDIYVEKEE